MQSDSCNLTRFWLAKTEEILSSSHLSPAKKLLAYKIFLRPLLIYDWFEGSSNQLKSLEVEALKHIFNKAGEQCLYERYTDIDVTNYIRLQEIRWKRSTGCNFAVLRRMLHELSSTAADPSPYFTRASDKKKLNCEHQHNVRSISTSTSCTSSSMTVLRRSTRLANKKKLRQSRRE